MLLSQTGQQVQIAVSWIDAPCGLLVVHQHFEWTHCQFSSLKMETAWSSKTWDYRMQQHRGPQFKLVSPWNLKFTTSLMYLLKMSLFWLHSTDRLIIRCVYFSTSHTNYIRYMFIVTLKHTMYFLPQNILYSTPNSSLLKFIFHYIKPVVLEHSSWIFNSTINNHSQLFQQEKGSFKRNVPILNLNNHIRTQSN